MKKAMALTIIPHNSPNYDMRPKGCAIDTLVIHHTGMSSEQSALNRLCSLQSRVSSHYLISADGKVMQLVADEYMAWHAGRSCWHGRSELNFNSIGIELDNNGVDPFPPAQMQSLVALALSLIEKYSIEPKNVVAHADIAPNRKVDPSQHFDWKLLNHEGIGLYSNISVAKVTVLHKLGDAGQEISSLRNKLQTFGYNLPSSNLFDRDLLNVIHAFKRHHVPETYHDTFWDNLAEARLNDLVLQLS